jgi:hypothetical protein
MDHFVLTTADRAGVIEAWDRHWVVRYALTSLPSHVADAEHLLTLAREHWQIENGVHYMNGCPNGMMKLRKDRSTIRKVHEPSVTAMLRDMG